MHGGVHGAAVLCAREQNAAAAVASMAVPMHDTGVSAGVESLPPQPRPEFRLKLLQAAGLRQPRPALLQGPTHTRKQPHETRLPPTRARCTMLGADNWMLNLKRTSHRDGHSWAFLSVCGGPADGRHPPLHSRRPRWMRARPSRSGSRAS